MSIDAKELMYIRNSVKSITDEIGRKIIGSQNTIKFMFIAMTSSNHILLEGVPGLAKTLIANEFASILIFKPPLVPFQYPW